MYSQKWKACNTSQKWESFLLPEVRKKPAPLQNPTPARLLPDAPLRFPYINYNQGPGNSQGLVRSQKWESNP